MFFTHRVCTVYKYMQRGEGSMVERERVRMGREAERGDGEKNTNKEGGRETKT